MMKRMSAQVSPYRLLPRPYSYLAGLGIIFWALLFSGCVAQKADLARVQQDLEDQIKRLNQEKQELAGIISKNRAETESFEAQQKSTMQEFRRSRAEIRQDLKALREADLTTLTGDIEEINFRLTKVRQDLEAQNSQTNSRFQTVESQIDEQVTTLTKHDSSITSNQDQLTALVQQIDQDSQAQNQQFSEFQTSLTSFKESMTSLGNQLVEETERANQADTGLRGQLDQKIDGLVTTVSSLESQQTTLETDIQTQKSNIQEVSTSIGQIREALEQSGTLVGGQVSTIETNLTKLETNLSQLETHVNSLTEKLNTDTQSLRTYLEDDVKASMNSMSERMTNQQRPLVTRLDTAQGQIQSLETQAQQDATHLQELTQSVLSLKEKQEFVGGLLGERGDKFMQESGRLSERLNLLEAHQSELTKQMGSNNQGTAKHLADVNTSLASVTQALENTSSTLATRLDDQEQKMSSLSSSLQALQQVKGEMESNVISMQSSTQATNEMRQALEKVTSRLQDLEVHQSGLVGKLDADAQTMNLHLTEVNTGITSVASAVEQVEKKLNTRIEGQDRKLNQALTVFQSSQDTSDATQANLNHLNQLTQTINQLRDVVDTIGTKLGGRVDQHESRLSQLAKRVNLLSSKGKK